MNRIQTYHGPVTTQKYTPILETNSSHLKNGSLENEKSFRVFLFANFSGVFNSLLSRLSFLGKVWPFWPRRRMTWNHEIFP